MVHVHYIEVSGQLHALELVWTFLEALHLSHLQEFETQIVQFVV